MAGQRSVGCQGSSGAAKQPGSPHRCTFVKGLSCIPSPSQPKPFQTQNVKYIPSRYLLIKLTDIQKALCALRTAGKKGPCGEGTLVSSSGVCWAGFAGSTSKVTPVTTYLFLTPWKGIKMQAISYSGASDLLCVVYFLFSLSHCPNPALEKEEQDSHLSSTQRDQWGHAAWPATTKCGTSSFSCLPPSARTMQRLKSCPPLLPFQRNAAQAVGCLQNQREEWLLTSAACINVSYLTLRDADLQC